MEDNPFEELLQSVRQVGAILRGARKPSRSQDLPHEPVETCRLDGHKHCHAPQLGTGTSQAGGRRRDFLEDRGPAPGAMFDLVSALANSR